MYENNIIVVGGNDTPDKVWDSNFLYSPKSHINSLEGKNLRLL